MYCTHCGKEIIENKVEAEAATLDGLRDQVITEKTRIVYECPRCGTIVHHGLDHEETKSLSRAAHAEIQRGRNSFAIGMGNACIGAILLAISIIFFRLSYKASNNFDLSTECVEFYVFLVLLIMAVALLATGLTFVGLGYAKQEKYKNLLKDIQNETFVQ